MLRLNDEYHCMAHESHCVEKIEARQLEEIFSSVETAGDTLQKAWCNRRDHSRRSFRASCVVRYLAVFGSEVLEVEGSTRDLSRGGIGLVIREPLPLDTEVYVTVELATDRSVDLQGRVVFSQQIQPRWRLLGVRFGPVDKRLCPVLRPGKVYTASPHRTRVCDDEADDGNAQSN